MRLCRSLSIVAIAVCALAVAASASVDFYKRCVTVADSISVSPVSGPSATNRCETVVIHGGIRLGEVGSPSDTAWVDCLLEYQPPFIEVIPSPTPDVEALFAEHTQASIPHQHMSGVSITYEFDTAPGWVGFSTWPDMPGDFTLWETRETTLHVVGHNVWMLGEGLRFDRRVHVTGANNASLVIVGGRNGTHAWGGETYFEAGIWFFGGIESDIPLILVSDGQVRIEQYQDTNLLTQLLPKLSIYASSALFTGPQVNSGQQLRLAYDPAGMDGLIDWLGNEGALPNVEGSTTATKPSTWGGLKLLYSREPAAPPAGAGEPPRP